MPNTRTIDAYGVRVHNLKNLNIRMPLQRMTVMTGVSGSGKSSLAFDTLYAEGQRRYIESFSTYARQFFDQIERPDVDRIEHIPPAIAIRQGRLPSSARSTVATVTELHDHLRLLFAKLGQVHCDTCQSPVTRHDPASVAKLITQFPESTRFQVCCPLTDNDRSQLVSMGFGRIILGDRTLRIAELGDLADIADAWLVIDRLKSGTAQAARVHDSLETAFRFGNSRCVILASVSADERSALLIDEQHWLAHHFDCDLRCSNCGTRFADPEPRLFSFNSPLGACRRCTGYGSIPEIAFDKLIPDPNKTLRQGAIAAWTTPAYKHEMQEMIELADDYDLPLDIPFKELSAAQRALIHDGVPERQFGGLTGFFSWLERHKYKVGVRAFLSRWRSFTTCGDCDGHRLQPHALAVRIAGRHLGQVCRLTVDAGLDFCRDAAASVTSARHKPAQLILDEIRSRLDYLRDVGLGYLPLDRRAATLSSGESERVALTAALGSRLVNTLFVLDEPSAGLHPRDSERVLDCIRRLRDQGNTVVVVEHDESFIKQADWLVDLGPGAGQSGGEVVFEGRPQDISQQAASVTGAFLSRERDLQQHWNRETHTPADHMRLSGACLHNLKQVAVEFPLNRFCVVTGVSGSGKSSLVNQTLYPAVCRAIGQKPPADASFAFDQLTGFEAIDEVLLVDQTPIGRSSRSNPVTYLKAFDDIRNLFAKTNAAETQNLTPGHFSFNVAGGGRCPHCEGQGSIWVDMHFLDDINVPCPECGGTRYESRILDVKYRGLNIAEVLSLTVSEAFVFFRGCRKIQKRLHALKEAGLDYLPLGQPTSTLSGGESQRLKLASRMATSSRAHTLFLLDEPSVGLHPADLDHLLTCFDHLLSSGHSLIVVEHDTDVIRAANHIIDLGPEAGESGGRVVAAGNLNQIRNCAESITGRFLDP